MNMMIKNMIYGLISVVIFGFSSTGFAQANPFSDVSRGNWSYDAIKLLIQQNLVTGYDTTTIKEDQILTRVEMAVIVAKAMSKEDTASDNTKRTIDQLAVEYAEELKAIGVVPKVSQSKLDRFTVNGMARVRFEKGKTNGPTVDQGGMGKNYTPNSHINLDLLYNYQLNKDWSLFGESEFGRQLNSGTESQTLQNSIFEQMCVIGPVIGMNVKIGRFTSVSPYGMVYDDKVTGVQFTFGKKLQTIIESGKATSTDDGNITIYSVNDGTVTATSTPYSSQIYNSVLLKTPVSPVSNVQLGYYKIGAYLGHGQSVVQDKNIGYVTGAFDSNFAKNLNLRLAFSHSNASAVKTTCSDGTTIASSKTLGYVARIDYKKADITKIGSYECFILYRMSPRLSCYSDTDNWRQNVKGIRVGCKYVTDINTKLYTWYTFGKDVDTNAKNNEYRVEYQFFI